MRDDDDDDIRRQNYERLFGTSAEREAEAAEMAERQAQNKRAEVLAWARQRAEAREGNLPTTGKSVVTKSAPVTQRAAAAAPASMTQEWAAWVKRAIKKEALAGDKAMADAIGQTVGRDLIALERRNAELEQRVKDVESELHDMVLRARERDGLDEMRERIRQLEAAPTGRSMKIVNG